MDTELSILILELCLSPCAYIDKSIYKTLWVHGGTTQNRTFDEPPDNFISLYWQTTLTNFAGEKQWRIIVNVWVKVPPDETTSMWSIYVITM